MRPEPEWRHPRGVLDTSVVIDLGTLAAAQLPVEATITSLTLAELAAGVAIAADPLERAKRFARYERCMLDYRVLDFDSDTAQAFSLIYAASVAVGRSPRGRRSIDLLIAAIAARHGLPLYTRNPDDFAGLDGVVTVVAV